MITIQNYQENALRTESPSDAALGRFIGSQIEAKFLPKAHSNLRLVHAALGIASDVQELVHSTDSVNEVEELGDLYWFTAIAYEALGLNIASAFEGSQAGREVLEHSRLDYFSDFQAIAATIADTVKAVVFYGKTQKEGMSVEQYLLGYLQVLTEIIADYNKAFHGLSAEEVMQKNIDKLRARYPDKFTEADAENRDKAAERAAISATVEAQVRAVLLPFEGKTVTQEALGQIAAALRGVTPGVNIAVYEDDKAVVFAPFDLTDAEIAAYTDMQEAVKHLKEKLSPDAPVTDDAGVAVLNDGLAAAGFKTRVRLQVQENVEAGATPAKFLVTEPIQPLRAHVHLDTTYTAPEPPQAQAAADPVIQGFVDALEKRGVDAEPTQTGVIHALTPLSPETKQEVASEVKETLRDSAASAAPEGESHVEP